MRVVVTGGKASGPAGPSFHPALPRALLDQVDTGGRRTGAAARRQSRANPSRAHNPVTRSSSATAAAPAVTVS